MSESIEQIEARLAAAADDAARIPILHELAFRLYYADPQRALHLADESYRIAIATGDRAAEAASLRTIANCHECLSDYPAAMSFAQRAHQLYRKLGDRHGVANALNSIGIIARGMTSYGEALAAFEEALELFRESDDLIRLAAVYNNIGTVHSSIGNYAEALEAYLASVRIYEEKNEELHVAIITSNIGIIHYYLLDYDLSFQYHSRSLDVFRRLGLAYDEALALGNLSSIYKVRGDYEAALDAIQQELTIFKALKEKRFEATTRIKLGALLSLRNEPEAALAQMELATEIAEEIGNLDTLSDAQRRIGELRIQQQEFDKAIMALARGLAIAEERMLRKEMADLYGMLATAYNGNGNTDTAFAHLAKSMELKEALYGEERQRAIAEMQVRFDVERSEREREVLRLKNEHLEELMAQRSKDLTALAMHLVRKNTFLLSLRKDALRFAGEHPEAHAAFDEMLAAIAENIHGDDDWQRFEQEFQHVHQGFVQMLSERYSRLTPTELKVCALLKINLSNKEIARLLSVSLRNVESHRYSIRKKLGLASDINLSSYLAGL